MSNEMRRAHLLFRAIAIKESFYLVDLKDNMLMDKLTEVLAYQEYLDYSRIELILDTVWLFSSSSSEFLNDNIEEIDKLLDKVIIEESV